MGENIVESLTFSLGFAVYETMFCKTLVRFSSHILEAKHFAKMSKIFNKCTNFQVEALIDCIHRLFDYNVN